MEEVGGAVIDGASCSPVLCSGPALSDGVVSHVLTWNNMVALEKTH